MNSIFIPAKVIALIAVLSALSNILSSSPFVIPFAVGSFNSGFHLAQLPIFISGILAGPWVGFITGIIGGLYMSFSVEIPFIVGGLGILGFFSGIFSHKMRIKPIFSCILAWIINVPYVFISDYIWFVSVRGMPSPVALATVLTIILTLTVEVLIASGLIAIIIPYLKNYQIG